MRTAIYVSLIAITALSAFQSASAQEGAPTRGARFNYAPNVYKVESANLPKGYGQFATPTHNVRAGGVPSKSLLGLDPAMLQKPMPIPQPVVAARPAATSVTSQVSVPKTWFNPMFGTPNTVAQLPSPMPQQAVAMPIAPARPQHAVTRSAPVANHAVRTGLSGRVRLPKRHNVTPLMASPAVASYGKNFGYVPGPLLPSNSGGASATSSVSGKIMYKK